MKLEVAVHFHGVVEVEMPDYITETARKILAEKVALAYILATTENDDNGECLESACDEFIAETDYDEAEFDQAKCVGVGGTWSLEDGTSIINGNKI